MSRVEDVKTSLWEDEDFDELSPDAKLIYLWSFTNDRCGMSGVYRVRRRSIAEGCLPTKRRDEAVKELEEHGFLRYVDGWVWVRSRVKHLRTKGSKMATGVVRDIERVPVDHPLRAAFLTEYLENTWVSKPLQEANVEGLSIPHPTPSEGLQGQGRGQGQGPGKRVEDDSSSKKGSKETLTKKQLREDWDRWLGHYHETTGRTAVEGSEAAKRLFKARRQDGRTVEELMEATEGCHGEEHLRENGYDRPETILAATKFERYIELARKQKASSNGHAGRPDRSAYERVEAAE